MADLLDCETYQRAARLTDWSRQAAAAPFRYGVSDCALFPADWCLAESGIDPAAPVRGRYDSDETWLDLAAEHGGLRAFWQELGETAGLASTADPAVGDIALIDCTGVGLCGAIRTDRRWLAKLARGIVGLRWPNIVQCWSVPSCPAR